MSSHQPMTLYERAVAWNRFPWIWLVAVSAIFPILLFMASVFLDNRWSDLDLSELERVLVVPAIILYILVLQPMLARRFESAMDRLKPRIVLTEDDFADLLSKLMPRPMWEWISFAAGAAAGILVERPWGVFPYWKAILFGLFGEGFAFGLIFWFLYTSLARTRALSDLHRQPIGQLVAQEKALDPVILWSLQVALAFLGLFAISAALLGGRMGGSSSFPVFAGLLLLAIFGYLLKRGVSTVLSSVYQSRILYSLILLFLTAVAGTVGYRVLQGWAWMDGLYMTIITMTTVGYGETHELTAIGRVFTMILVITSIGIAGYAISTVAGYVVEGEFNRIFRSRRMDKRISKLNNHVILCGVGRIGREIAEELYKTLTPFLVIEPNEESLSQLPFLEEVPYLQGDATRDEILRRAGIERASGLLATLSDDQANVFLVLSVRALNPKIRIIARLAHDENRKKLLRAGADDVVHTEAIGGLRMASMMLRPSVVTFLDQMLRVTGETLRVEEVVITPALADRTLGELNLAERTGLLVMAFKPVDRKTYEFNPPVDTPLRKGDVLIVMGSPKQTAKARQMTL